MLTSKPWQKTTSFFLALGLSVTSAIPLMGSVAEARVVPQQTAQLFRNGNGPVLREGTLIRTTYNAAERIIVKTDETAKLTLTVAEDVLSERGTVLIRRGSAIEGEIRPVDGGSQFFAETLVPASSNRRFPIAATSDVITRTETITRRSNPNILRGAAIGAAAAAILAEIFGRIDLGEVLAGAGLGVLGEILLRRPREVEVVVIDPNTDLDLRLTTDFTFQRQAQRLGDVRLGDFGL
ncbi:MAG TPA: hypothetical protein IGS37_16070 [Synechococcales cyanobacterium M55_K2018_004]|nr:hypothetical protein [Synechococcales cyanobacterium M55_K2018_004]